MSQPTTDFFNKETALKYDERNSKLSRIADCLHFLTTLVLKDLPAQARILCVGAGTGAEISFDLNSKEFPLMLKGWEQVQTLMGATPESLATLPTQLREILTVLPPIETENLLRQSGIQIPLRFFKQ